MKQGEITKGAMPLLEHFGGMVDPRSQNQQYSLSTILALAICSVLCGADSWLDIAEFSEARQEWFASFLELPNGVPSHDTFRRVFSLLDPQGFAEHFSAWTKSLAPHLPETVIAIDGKQLRGSTWRAGGAINMVSAWSAAKGLAMAQVKVDGKSNEITAVPELLKLLHLKGAIVTLDAMGCQRTIAKDIVERGGSYVLALKLNQGGLMESAVDAFKLTDQKKIRAQVTENGGHGRYERRVASVISDPATLWWLQQVHHWPHLAAIGKIEATRTVAGEKSSAIRYYLLSSVLAPEAFGAAVRTHWEVENKLHWTMDVTFNEDRCRGKLAAENLSRLRQLSLNLLRLNPRKDTSLRCRRKVAGWSNEYLKQLLLS